jgi:glycosyltransferase involved in cell wall biosynthesis
VAFVVGTLGQGGAERQLYYALKALVAEGAAPVVLALTRGEHWEGPIGELGVPIVFVGGARSRAARMWSIYRAIRRTRPAVVQSFHFYTNLYAAVAARAAGVPAIGALRSDGANELRTIGTTMARWSLQAPHLIAANSPVAIANVTAAGYTTPLALLRNAIDTSHFTFEPEGSSTTIRVAAIGRLGPEKRFDRLLRVLARVAAAHPALETRIAGAGPLRDVLENQARALGLDSLVTFMGPVDDIRPLLQWSTCIALTSDYEGTPNVLLEAMATGRPVVATRVGGVPGLVEDGATGLLADADDETALAQAIISLHHSPELAARLAANGRQYVIDHHSLATLGRSLLALYSRVA